MFKSILTLSTLLLSATALPSGFPTSNYPNPGSLSTRGAPCATQAQRADNDTDNRGPGVQVHNADGAARSFFVYMNSCDAIPLKYTSIAAGATKFIALPPGFQGRIVRGSEQVNLDGQPHLLATWLEITLDGTGKGYGDVSLIRGCDGAVTLAAADGSGVRTGFRDEGILDDAPKGILEGGVIKATEGLASAVVQPVVDYLARKIGYDKAYIDDYHGNPVISSSNERFQATFYKGR
ncbi:hypothetical protein GGS26DRAFT_102380 [Hypomontagnella submonticulosa]|nr:hypothetical protein GGS26DRAFT_102380 [Hypomontagnella submonticulosa]